MTTKIGIIICSQRTPRAGAQIAQWVFNAIKDVTKPDPTSASASASSVSLNLIDLSTWNLPFCNEPGVPSQISSVDEYVHPHTRAWSAEISSHDAFVFVTPQYNWGYPASVKNAIDYLYHEWKGKPAMIVSYGGRGGGRAAEQLKQVLQGVRMRPVEKMVALAFLGREFTVKAATGQPLGLDEDAYGEGDGEEKERVWAKERVEIGEAFGELLTLLREDNREGEKLS
jgi:NAD(P)H-dependent FMN reductase